MRVRQLISKCCFEPEVCCPRVNKASERDASCSKDVPRHFLYELLVESRVESVVPVSAALVAIPDLRARASWGCPVAFLGDTASTDDRVSFSSAYESDKNASDGFLIPVSPFFCIWFVNFV